ncbi:hypothetical protein DL98DRAFT_519792 [Cadophora sp. DSE1049]|nr:hypothetical protein DL98DRAFT_519792 [Cadophora sp. DSE1049]
MHDNDAYCPFPHCGAFQAASSNPSTRRHNPFTTRHEIAGHMAEIHEADPEQGLQCTLRSCGSSTIQDVWSGRGLRIHLLECHDVQGLAGYDILENLENAGSRVLSVNHFTHPNPEQSRRNYTGPWRDCTTCAPQAQHHDGASFSRRVNGGN